MERVEAAKRPSARLAVPAQRGLRVARSCPASRIGLQYQRSVAARSKPQPTHCPAPPLRDFRGSAHEFHRIDQRRQAHESASLSDHRRGGDIAIGVAGYFAFAGQQRVPDATFTLLSRQKVTTADLKGKVYLVNFWATSCDTCTKEMPQMVQTRITASKAKGSNSSRWP